MPQLLRKVRKSRWQSDDLARIDDCDVPADALGDVSTQSNTLSVWWISDDSSNLDRVVAALAATCDNVSNFDYALVDVGTVSELGIELKPTSGESADAEANSLWHRDAVRLSGCRLLQLAKALSRAGNFKRYQKNRVLALLKQNVEDGHIRVNELKEGIKKVVLPL